MPRQPDLHPARPSLQELHLEPLKVLRARVRVSARFVVGRAAVDGLVVVEHVESVEGDEEEVAHDGLDAVVAAASECVQLAFGDVVSPNAEGMKRISMWLPTADGDRRTQGTKS